MPHYAIPADEYRKNNPMKYYNAAIYIDNHRITSSKDYDMELIHRGKASVEQILKALKVPEDIMKQIEFED